MKSAFLRLDDAFANACSVDHGLSSGTTALTALLSGRFVLLIIPTYPLKYHRRCLALESPDLQDPAHPSPISESSLQEK